MNADDDAIQTIKLGNRNPGVRIGGLFFTGGVTEAETAQNVK
jgi:hypothetical protein